MKCGWYRVTIKVSKCAPVDGGYGETWVGRNSGKKELLQGGTWVQEGAGWDVDLEGGGVNGFCVYGRQEETERK